MSAAIKLETQKGVVPSMFDDVGEFHAKFGLPVTGEHRQCRPMDFETSEYRIGFLREELEEFESAVTDGRLADQVDGLIDLAWVALGTLHYLGAPGNEAWAEVRRANLAKRLQVTTDPAHKRGSSEKIVKPEGWAPPDIRAVISAHNARVRVAPVVMEVTVPALLAEIAALKQQRDELLTTVAGLEAQARVNAETIRERAKHDEAERRAAEAQCDGDHAGLPCADPHCWLMDTPEEGEAASARARNEASLLAQGRAAVHDALPDETTSPPMRDDRGPWADNVAPGPVFGRAP